jgi:hypothetical protein
MRRATQVICAAMLLLLSLGCGPSGATINVQGTPYDFVFVNLTSTIPSDCCSPQQGCSVMAATPLDVSGNGAVFNMVDNVEYQGAGLYTGCQGFVFVDYCASSVNMSLCGGAFNRDLQMNPFLYNSADLECKRDAGQRSATQVSMLKHSGNEGFWTLR